MASWLRFIMLLGMLLLGLGGWRSVQAAPPSYQAAGTDVSGTGSVSPAWPAHAVNDVALLFVESTGGQAVTLSTPAGFVAVANSPQASGTGTAGTRLSVFWARATSTSMPTPTIADPGDHVYAQILTYRNVYRYGNPWDVTAGGVKATASTSLTVTSMNTTVNDTLVVQAAARDANASGAGFSAQTNASLAGIVERSDAGTTAGNGGGFAVWDGPMPSAGATGTTTVTVASSINAFVSIALKPDVFDVAKTASLTSVPINTNFTFTLSARNPVNAADQAGVVITDDLGADGLNFSSCSTASGTCTYTGGVVTWNVGSVAAGTTKTATLIVNASSAGAKINTMTSNVGTPVASASATVQAYAPLADWRMDEASWNGTANEVKDSSGGGYHGRSKVASGTTSVATTLTGSPAYTSPGGSQNTCRYGEFDKTTSPARSYSYVELTGLPALPSSFTFAVWIKSSNPSYVGQRILVRDDADNGWSFSLGDSGAARLRFFNRNISPSGAPIVIAGPGNGRNNLCGSVFCLDSDAVITAGNWFFVAVSIDTTGKVITNYLFDAAGTLVSSTSSAFTGTWQDGTGTAAIGGETSASGELPSNYHFQGNIDEMQIYSGVLSQADLSLLRTRSRTCGVSVDHYELSVPTSNLTCLPSTVTVTACANASSPCSSPVTTISGQTATLSSGAATLGSGSVTFNASGVTSTTLSYPSATDGASVTVTLSGEQVTANNARQCCPNGTSCTVASSCTATFNTAGFVISSTVGGSVYTVPTQTAGTASSTLYLRAIKTSSTTNACESALSGANTINWANQCKNPTTCDSTNRMNIDGGTATTVQGNPNSGVSSYTPVSMTFDANGNAPFTFNYADAGLVTLYATKAAGGSLLSSLSGSSNAFVVKPGGFTLSNIKQTALPQWANPAAAGAAGSVFIKAGEAFTATITATTSTGAATPNFGKESVPEGVLLTPSLVAPSGGAVGALSHATVAGTSFGGGVATVSNLAWDEVGIITLTPSVADGDYLGAGAVTGTTSGNIGRFIPDHFTLTAGTTTPACSSAFTYFGQDGLATTFTVTAQNLANGTTRNYTDGFAKLGLNTWAAYGFSAATLPAGSALSASATAPTGSWPSLAAAQPNRGMATVTARHVISRPGALTGITGLTISAAPAPDADAVAATSTAISGVSNFYYGRIRLDNAYGSELLDLPMTMRSEYWNGTGWVLNNADTCTNATLAFTAASTPNITGNTCVWDTGTAPGNSGVGCAVAPAAGRQYRETGVAGFAGDFNLWLRAPGAGNPGSMDVTATVPSWLQYNWRGTVANPTGRATFGVYRSPLIYRREDY